MEEIQQHQYLVEEIVEDICEGNSEGESSQPSSNPLAENINPFTFPYRLYDLLEGLLGHSFHEILHWKSHGLAFVISDMERLEAEVLPVIFNRKLLFEFLFPLSPSHFPSLLLLLLLLPESKWSSFQRQLNLYGFQKASSPRVSTSPSTNNNNNKNDPITTYFHRSFQRNRKELLKTITRIGRNCKKEKSLHNKAVARRSSSSSRLHSSSSSLTSPGPSPSLSATVTYSTTSQSPSLISTTPSPSLSTPLTASQPHQLPTLMPSSYQGPLLTLSSSSLEEEEEEQGEGSLEEISSLSSSTSPRIMTSADRNDNGNGNIPVLLIQPCFYSLQPGLLPPNLTNPSEAAMLLLPTPPTQLAPTLPNNMISSSSSSCPVGYSLIPMFVPLQPHSQQPLKNISNANILFALPPPSPSSLSLLDSPNQINSRELCMSPLQFNSTPTAVIGEIETENNNRNNLELNEFVNCFEWDTCDFH